MSTTVLMILIAAAAIIIGFVLGILYRKTVGEREIISAEEEAKRIINESIKSAESRKKEALLEAKEEIHRSRSEYEREEKERRSELKKLVGNGVIILFGNNESPCNYPANAYYPFRQDSTFALSQHF